MRTSKKYLFLTLSLISTFFFLISASYASAFCIFGFCIPSGSIEINKLVENPKTSVMVDNLSANDPKYSPRSIINFQLKLTNTSNTAISKVSIKDIFPQFVDFDQGGGIYDARTKTLSLEVSDLKPKETRIFNFSGRVSSDLSFSEDSLCVVNKVSATIRGGSTVSDNSGFCIDKKTSNELSVEDSVDLSSSPATGGSSLLTFLLIPAGLIGWRLRKYEKIK